MDFTEPPVYVAASDEPRTTAGGTSAKTMIANRIWRNTDMQYVSLEVLSAKSRTSFSAGHPYNGLSHVCLRRTPGRVGKARVYDGDRTRPAVGDDGPVDGRPGAGRPAWCLLPERPPTRQAGHGHSDDFQVSDRCQGTGVGRDGQFEEQVGRRTDLNGNRLIFACRARRRSKPQSARAGRAGTLVAA